MDLQADLKQLFGLVGIDYRHNLDREALFAAAIANDRGRICANGPDNDPKAYATALGNQGPLIYYSDPSCTGRPVQDTFAVAWPDLEDQLWWKSDFQRFDPEHLAPLMERVAAHLNERDSPLFVQDTYCGWDPAYAVPYRLISEYATHALFASHMFADRVAVDDPESRRWTLLNVPSFHCEPERDGTLSARAVIVDIRHRVALVLGRADYCGVVKKTLFTVMNYLLPANGDLPMHCSANVGPHGDSAILFGLSGTGKTTLSADPERQLIGDDEHAWTADGVSNFEGGCYAKLIDLDKRAEPVIAAALSMPCCVIENVPPLPDRPLSQTDPQDLDLSDNSITDNTRLSYPLAANPNVADGARGPHPQTLVLLTADAFGVLPPISILDEKDVMYHFVSGFTSRLAGTEVGVTEPQGVFSACFGAPFMARPPSVYAKILAARMTRHHTRCVLLNTGWTGGPHGVGQRISIAHTRALLDAALAGDLDDIECDTHPIFNLAIPRHCPGVPSELLDPRSTWDDPQAYDTQAQKLRDMFRANYRDKNFAALGIDAVM
ncbi:MAG: phosphoenolpyruvate carboxykinase (ATP) [Salinisphaera sp.]|jgi:phosphoenolpyruvate carboxykinase (ATP)|nr:phosphoenolpyruvate carboxykinase (ATP) [Salinisphaera sp.]